MHQDDNLHGNVRTFWLPTAAIPTPFRGWSGTNFPPSDVRVCVYPADVCYDDNDCHRRQYVKNRFNLQPTRTQVRPQRRAYFPLFFFFRSGKIHTNTHHSFNCFFCAQLNFPQKHHSLFPGGNVWSRGKIRRKILILIAAGILF